MELDKQEPNNQLAKQESNNHFEEQQPSNQEFGKQLFENRNLILFNQKAWYAVGITQLAKTWEQSSFDKADTGMFSRVLSSFRNNCSLLH